jgi:hypothetical protein
MVYLTNQHEGVFLYRVTPCDRPTLVVNLDNSKSAEHQLELSYLTGGLAWKADYVAELNNEDTALDLNGWVTLTNTSGTTYPNAKLQLVAGDVNRVYSPRESCGCINAIRVVTRSLSARIASITRPNMKP